MLPSKICLLTATFADKDYSLSDTLLSDNLSNSQETFVEGDGDICSACMRSISKSHNQNTYIKWCDAALSYPWWWGVNTALFSITYSWL